MIYIKILYFHYKFVLVLKEPVVQVVGLEVVLLYITHHQNTQVNSLPMVDSHQQVMVEQAQCMSPQVQKLNCSQTTRKYTVYRYNVQKRKSVCLNRFRFMVSNSTFNNISVISWQSVLLVEETGVPKENLSQVTDKLDHIMLYRITS